MEPTSEAIESRLRELDSDIEFLAVEPAGTGGLRIVIDHPDGVSLGLCESVAAGLSELRSDFALEISSPGPERPLTRPEHFEQFTGRRARLSTRLPKGGRSNFTGTIREVSAGEVGIECDGVLHRIPHDDIKRAHLAPDIPEGAAK